MAKMEEIGNMQVIDNKEDKFFYFPMISMPCTGSGYTERLLIIRFSAVFILSGIHKRYGPFSGNIAVVKQWNKVFGKR